MADAREVYEFGAYLLDVGERRLCNAGQNVPLAPEAHDVLVALVRRAGTLVTKSELLDLVWGDVSVEEGVLSVCTFRRFARASLIPAGLPPTSRPCRGPGIDSPPTSVGGLSSTNRSR